MNMKDDNDTSVNGTQAEMIRRSGLLKDTVYAAPDARALSSNLLRQWTRQIEQETSKKRQTEVWLQASGGATMEIG